MKVKIICNGFYSSPGGGLMTETGERIEGVREIYWHIGPKNEVAEAVVHFVSIPVELQGEITKIELHGWERLRFAVNLACHRLARRILGKFGIER